MNEYEALLSKIEAEFDITREELNKRMRQTFVPLKKKLEEIGKCSMTDSIKDLTYKDFVDYNSAEEDLDSVQTQHNISEDNVSRKCEKFRCVCGKTHLKNLHLFTHKNKEDTIIIGSSCIEQLTILRDLYKDNEELAKRIDTIYLLMKKGERTKTHNKCITCKEYNINKKKINEGSPLEIEIKNKICRRCRDLVANKIRCKDCMSWIEISKDYKGQVKRRCLECWKTKKKATERQS